MANISLTPYTNSFLVHSSSHLPRWEPVTGVYYTVYTDGQLVALNWEYLRELYKNVKWRYRIIRAQDEDDL
jgi:hypothetical protein